MRLPAFRSGAQARPAFEAGRLSLDDKEALCRSLLAEFGVKRVNANASRHELIHSCALPLGGHSNGDRNPSASLNYEKLTYNCLGCDNSGGLLWFIATCRGETTQQARVWLESETGLGADVQDLQSLLSYLDSLYAEPERTPIPRMNPDVLRPWQFIHPYMTEVRRIPEETLIRFNVGYGVISVKIDEDEFGRPIVVKSHRIVIPHFWRGDLVGWQSRRLGEDGTPKYLSTGDFPKDSTLYHYDERAEAAVVVESPMSVLSKAHLEPHIEATFGHSITDRQVILLSIHRKVILWLDNDGPSWDITERVGEALTAYSQVWVVESPWNADPADMDDETYLDLVREAVPYEVWTRPVEVKKWELA